MYYIGCGSLDSSTFSANFRIEKMFIKTSNFKLNKNKNGYDWRLIYYTMVKIIRRLFALEHT